MCDERHTLGKHLLTRGEELFDWHLPRFESLTNDIIVSGSTKNTDHHDFSAELQLNNERILLVSYSVRSKEFKNIYNKIPKIKPSVVVFCAKGKDRNNTVYKELDEFLLSVPGEDYLEIPIQRIQSDQLRVHKNEYATDLFNIIVRVAEGQSFEEMAYHENKKIRFL